MIKRQIEEYLIDCIGYRYEDLSDLNKDEVLELVENTEDLEDFCK